MPVPPKRPNRGWDNSRKGKRRGTDCGRRRQTAACLLELTHTTVEQETAEAADAATAAAAIQQAAAQQTAAQQAAALQTEAEEDASPWRRTSSHSSTVSTTRDDGILVCENRELHVASDKTMVQLVPLPCPPAVQSASAGALPDSNVDGVRDFRPTAATERGLRETSLLMTHDQMFTYIDKKVVLHGTVVGCLPGSKTLQVEIDEFESQQTHESAVTSFEEAILEVPLRMVIQALVINGINKNL